MYFEYFLSVVREQLEGVALTDLALVILECALLVLLPGLVLAKLGKIKVKTGVLLFATAICMETMLLITVIRREPGSRSGSINTYLEWGTVSGNIYSLRRILYNILNVALFIPFGCLMYLLRSGEPRIKAMLFSILSGFLFSFFIEITQLITQRGVFELTDIVTNVLGTGIGALIGTFLVKREKGNETD